MLEAAHRIFDKAGNDCADMTERKKRILVVDDEPDIVTVLELRLKSAGYDVGVAYNGRQGLEKIRETLPDLIISDVLMPDMDGFAFYKELKKSKVTADIPIIILTARGKMEDAFEAVGVDEFLAKPFDSKILMEKVANLLARSEVAQTVEPGKKILIAGTDNDIVDNMSRQLQKAGCYVDVVSTGPQVISKVVMFLPVVLVMEVQMDGMSAAEVIKVLRKLPQAEKIPLLVYSFYRVDELGSEDIRQKALSVDSAVRDCLEAGATEYLGRFNENNFIRVMSKYL